MLQEQTIFFINIVFLLPILILCIRGMYLQLKYMQYRGLRVPITLLFLAPIIFHLLTISSLFVSPFYEMVVSTFEKLILGFVLLTYFYVMREFVFFETLFSPDGVQNNPSFLSGNS